VTSYQLGDTAKADLADIWHYVAADHSAAADRLIDALIDSFCMLAMHPEAGRPRPELAESIRSIPVGSYIVLYAVREDEVYPVEVLRVVHGARDQKDLL
jgi:toxin ParE1/3/4